MKNLLCFFLLAGAILACQPKKAAPSEEPETPSTALADGEYCYLGTLQRDTTTLKITVSGNKVTGEYHWNPYEKDGALGNFEGTIKGNEIVALWKYTIEGSDQQRELTIVVEDGKAGIKEGEIELKGEVEVLKDPANAKVNEYMKKVDCL
jgi:hypothetical protein